MHSAASQCDDLLDTLAAIVWEADPRTFQFLYVSRGAEALIGYSLQEWLSRPTFWIDLLHPDDRDAAVAECLAAVEDGRDHDFEYRVVTADGSVRWLRDIVSVVCDDEGRVKRLRGLMVDMTATRAAVAAQIDADRYHRAVVEHGLDMTVITDGGGTILFNSPSVQRVLGISPEARLGQSVFQMIHPGDADRMKHLFADAWSSGGATAATLLRHHHDDGSWRVLEVIGRRIEDGQGSLAVINCRDVTDRVRLEEEFRLAQKMEALARITSAVAHDFNNLLMVIRGNAQLALGEETGGNVQGELTEIVKAAETGSSLIAQLMRFSGDKPRVVTVDVNDTVRTLQTILERMLGSAAVLAVDTAATLPRVQLEAGALEQVLINLVVNAREAMRAPGTVTIATRNRRIASPWSGSVVDRIDTFVEIEVTDTGAGMTPEVRDRIFELYFTTKEATRGTGLGLATVYAVVRDAGGTIIVDTEPGKGTAFRIRLPVGPAHY